MPTLAQSLASLIQARAKCAKYCNAERFYKHGARAEELVRAHMPSGSGFDAGTRLDFDASTAERLVFITDFHHMGESGT